MLDDPGPRELEFGFDFHLCAFQWIVVTSKRTPVDAISIRRMWTIKIQAVKIGVMASIVPPGSFVRLCAAFATIAIVIVVIFRRKLHATKRKMKIGCLLCHKAQHTYQCVKFTRTYRVTSTVKQTNKPPANIIENNNYRVSSKHQEAALTWKSICLVFRLKLVESKARSYWLI